MAKFSPTFAIDVTDSINSGRSTTITNPGVAFEIVDVVISGTNNGVATVRKNTSGGAQAAAATLTANGSSCQLLNADTDFLATDNVHIAVTVADVTRVTIICRSASAQTWTNSAPA